MLYCSGVQNVLLFRCSELGVQNVVLFRDSECCLVQGFRMFFAEGVQNIVYCSSFRTSYCSGVQNMFYYSGV